MSQSQLLGSGAYGQVHTWQLHNDVAIKRYPILEKLDINSIALRELLFCQNNVNPRVNCTEAFNIGHNGSTFYMHMKRQGVHLATWMQQQTKNVKKLKYIPTNQLLQYLPTNVWIHLPLILKGIANALVNIHQQNVIHADLKMENVLLNFETMEINVIDFGGIVVNRFIHSQPLCSVHVRAPEMFCKMEEQDGSHCPSSLYHFTNDIFSLGVIMLELILGAFVYFEQSLDCERYIYKEYMKINNIVNDDKENLSFITPEDLNLLQTFAAQDSKYSSLLQLVFKMLNKDFRKRPTAKEIVNLLNGLNKTESSLDNTSVDKPVNSVNDIKPVNSVNDIKRFGQLPSFHVNSNYIQFQTPCTWNTRKQCVNHLFQYCGATKCLPIFSLAVYLTDQFLSLRKLPINQWLKLSLVCLVIANDVSEYYIIHLEHIEKYLMDHDTKYKSKATTATAYDTIQTNIQAIHMVDSSAITLKHLQNFYLEILNITHFHIYYEMFDFRYLQLADTLGYQRLFVKDTFGYLYIPNNGLLNDIDPDHYFSKTNTVHQMYQTPTLDYSTVCDICMNETWFLQFNQDQLISKYKELTHLKNHKQSLNLIKDGVNKDHRTMNAVQKRLDNLSNVVPPTIDNKRVC